MLTIGSNFQVDCSSRQKVDNKAAYWKRIVAGITLKPTIDHNRNRITDA